MTWAPMPFGDARCVVAGHAAADDDDFRGCDAGDAAHQDAAAAVAAHHVIGADLGRQSSGDLTHRGEQRQCAVGGLDGFVGDRCGARREQGVGARLGRREVQVGEERLALAQPRVLGLDRLLDLQQQLGLGPHLVGAVDQLSAGPLEVGIGDRRTLARTGLDDHLVTAVDQLGDARGGDGDSVLVVLDLGRDSDAHDGS